MTVWIFNLFNKAKWNTAVGVILILGEHKLRRACWMSPAAFAPLARAGPGETQPPTDSSSWATHSSLTLSRLKEWRTNLPVPSKHVYLWTLDIVTDHRWKSKEPAFPSIRRVLANTNRKREKHPTSGEHLWTFADTFVVVRVLCAKIISWLADAAYFAGCPRKSFKVNPVNMQGGVGRRWRGETERTLVGLGCQFTVVENFLQWRIPFYRKAFSAA